MSPKAFLRNVLRIAAQVLPDADARRCAPKNGVTVLGWDRVVVRRCRSTMIRPEAFPGTTRRSFDQAVDGARLCTRSFYRDPAHVSRRLFGATACRIIEASSSCPMLWGHHSPHGYITEIAWKFSSNGQDKEPVNG